MDAESIRKAFVLLGFEEPLKDESQVKARYRALIKQHASDFVKDVAAKAEADEVSRRIHEAKNLCLEFCASSSTMEEIEQEGELNQEDAREQYMKLVQLFIGRVLYCRYRFWARVPISYPDAVPVFDETVQKFQLRGGQEFIFDLLVQENGRDEVRWVLGFHGEDVHPFAWVAMEMNDGSYQAQVFFHRPPKNHVLPEVTDTKTMTEALTSFLDSDQKFERHGSGRGVFWVLRGMERDSYRVIRITNGKARLEHLHPSGEWLPFLVASSVTDLRRNLETWIYRFENDPA